MISLNSSMRLLPVLAALFIAGLLSVASFAATSVDNVRVYRAPEYTRFVFDVSETPRYQVLPDAAPGRVIIDFRDAQLKAKPETVDLKDSPVRRVRSGVQADGTIRIVLDLAVGVRVNSFALPPNELYGNRLVVDLYDVPVEPPPSAETGIAPAGTPDAVKAAPVPVPAAAPAASAVDAAPTKNPPSAADQAPGVSAPATASSAATPAVMASVPAEKIPATAEKLPAATEKSPPVFAPPAGTPRPVATTPPLRFEPRPVIVAIDAGHGGEDPGARGPSGTREKDVVLSIARAVRDRMRDEPGMRPVLIRDGDYYIGLKERRQLARKKHNADLFVSIHADAFTRREARGASVFAVSRRGASSTLAAYLANSENRADLVGGIDPKNGGDLVNVLSDMMMEGTMRESLQLGRGVLDELGAFARLHKHSVEQAGFMVLKEPNMPSILIETGFISNPEEERLLSTAAYQQRLAGAIVKGVRSYFERFPPPDTWFAAHREGRVSPAAASTKETGARVVASVENLPAATDQTDPLMVLVSERNGSLDGADVVAASTPSSAPLQKRRQAASRPAAEKFVLHKVGKGQSLGWLANKYGVTQRQIKEANNLKRDDLRIGETLKIPKK